MALTRASLGTKVLVLVSLLTVLSFAGLFLANAWWQQETMLRHIHESAKRTSELLQQAIRKPMSIGDNAGTVSQFREASERHRDIRLYLTNYKGEVTYSTDTSILRQDLRAVLGNAGGFRGLLDRSLVSELRRGEVVEVEGRPRYAEVLTVGNQPECYHCHGKSRPILGSMVLLQDIADDYAELNSLLLKNGLISLAGLAVLLSALLVFINRTVIGRIKAIVGVTEEVSRGRLDVVFEAEGGDELADLGLHLTDMVATLRTKMREVEAKSAEAAAEAEKARQAMDQAQEARRKSQLVEEYQEEEIDRLAGVLTSIAEGDLTVRYQAGEAGPDADEARQGFLALERAVNATTSTLGRIIDAIQATSARLTASAEELSAVSRNLREGAETVSAKSGTVAGATEQISMNLGGMASAVEEMSVNVSSVSSTAEQMSQTMASVAASVDNMRRSIEAIAANAEDGAKVAAEAMSMARTATGTMSHLGEAAQEIGKVTAVIKRIAEQTNLLALNATIEAASAGDAGKGFAVVAKEIKELANQSARAAEDIAAKIDSVQGSALEAVRVIDEVSGIIGAINDSVQDISSAVERQTEAANSISLNTAETTTGVGHIAKSIAELSKGAGDISKNAGEMAKGAGDVAASIQGVNKSAETSNVGARRMSDLAANLAREAGELQEMVGRFNVE